MSEFTEEFTQLVTRAQDYQQMTDDAKAKAAEEWDRRAEELFHYLTRRFAELERSVAIRNNGVRYFQEDIAPSRPIAVLRWEATSPHRSLVAEYHEGRLSVGWRLGTDNRSIDWFDVDVLRATPESLDNLIRGIADQEAWASGEVPVLNVPRVQPALVTPP